MMADNSTTSKQSKSPRKQGESSSSQKDKPQQPACELTGGTKPKQKGKPAADASFDSSSYAGKPKAGSQGAASYSSSFKKAWSKEWCFITASNDPYSFNCVICNRDVSCRHQGKPDVERYISLLHESNTKTAEGQCRLPFVSQQDPLAQKVCR